MLRRHQRVVALVLLALLLGSEGMGREVQGKLVCAAETEEVTAAGPMSDADEKTTSVERVETEKRTETTKKKKNSDKIEEAQNDLTEILSEGNASEEKRLRVQQTTSDAQKDSDKLADIQNNRTEIVSEEGTTEKGTSKMQEPVSNTIDTDQTLAAGSDLGLTITSIETETDAASEEIAADAQLPAVLNGTVSTSSEEDAEQKQTATMTDGETDADQIESMESEPSTDSTEPATEAPVSEKVHLGIDNRHRYEGMEQSFADGYQPEIRDGHLYLTVPFTASGALQGDCLTVDLVFAEKENAPFVFKNYQKDVKRRTYLLQNGVMAPQETNSGDLTGTALATTEDPGTHPEQKEDPATVDQQDAYCYTCEIPIQENAAPGQYSVTVKAWGYTKDGERTELECQIFVHIPEPEPTADSKGSASGGSTGGGGYAGDGSGSETAEEVLHQPKLLLETCSLSGAPLTAGAEESMNVQFRNRSQTQTIYNLKVVASTDSKAVQPLRNSWYFASVAPGETIEIEDGVKVAMGAEDTGAVLSFDFEYEDKKGTAASGKENVPLSIDQPTSVELRMASVPAVLYAADTQEFSVQALNLSRVPVYNVRIQLSGTGLFPNEDVFIGNMAAGTEGNGAMQVYVGTRTMQAIGSDSGTEDAEKYGPVSGTITLEYEDVSGETHTQTESFQSEIKKPEVLSLKVEEAPETNAWWISVFAAVGAGMVLIIIILLFRLRKKSSQIKLYKIKS